MFCSLCNNRGSNYPLSRIIKSTLISWDGKTCAQAELFELTKRQPYKDVVEAQQAIAGETVSKLSETMSGWDG